MAYVDQFNEEEEKKMSFLDHLNELRIHIIRSAIAIFVLAIVVFSNPNILFDKILLAPKSADFITFKMFCKIAEQIPALGGLCFTEINFTLQNIDLTGQFFQHMSTSFIAGFILAFPYIIWELWRFVKPALKDQETKGIKTLIFWISMLFFTGVAFGYFLLAPVSVVFLGSYQISAEVSNQISLTSYLSTLSLLTLASGLIFELPVLLYFLAKIGIVNSKFLADNRRYAIVINLFLSALITPSDVASMILLAIPMLLLYEMGIFVVKRVEKKQALALKNED